MKIKNSSRFLLCVPLCGALALTAACGSDSSSPSSTGKTGGASASGGRASGVAGTGSSLGGVPNGLGGSGTGLTGPETSGGQGGSTLVSGGGSGGGSGGAGAVASACPATEVTITTAYPDAASVKTSQGSSFGPTPAGGTVADGVYYLTDRTMRGSGTVPSQEKAVIVISGETMTFWKWHIKPATDPGTAETVWAGTFKANSTSLDLSGLQTCWGSDSVATAVPFTASSTGLMLRFGIMDYALTKQ